LRNRINQYLIDIDRRCRPGVLTVILDESPDLAQIEKPPRPIEGIGKKRRVGPHPENGIVFYGGVVSERILQVHSLDPITRVKRRDREQNNQNVLGFFKHDDSALGVYFLLAEKPNAERLRFIVACPDV